MAIFKKNDNWYIDYYVNKRRKREKIGPNKRLAEKVLYKRLTESAENKFLDIKKVELILFRDMADEYMSKYSIINKRSHKRDLTSIRNLNSFMGDKYLSEITSEIIEEYKKLRLNQERTKATINRELSCLKHIFTKAIEWKKIYHDPTKGVKTFKENNARVRFLEKDEIKKLMLYCPDYLKPIVITALNTGMRLGEILNLTWQDVDFERQMLTIRETKNGEVRYVPVNNILLSALKEIKENNSSVCDYVFYSSKNNKWTSATISRRFKAVVDRAGILDFHFHDLRHTFASHLVMVGVELATVKELLGHKSFEMTLRYSHLSSRHKKRATELLYK
jgi:integrase